MVSTKWTDEQRKAIYTDNCDLLVAAGAGAGKTAVLVQRIIEKILNEEDPLDIDKLLIVTFTNAAASEMRERIGEAISSKLDENPDSKILKRQLALLPRSNIMTIHSFCLQVIKNNFHKVDIDPNFRIVDETEAILMKQEALDEIFDELYEKEDKYFLNLVESYTTKDDTNLQELVLNIHRFSKSSPLTYDWLINASEFFNVDDDFDFSKSKLSKIFLEDIKSKINGLDSILSKSINLIEEGYGIDYYLDTFKADYEFVKDLTLKTNFEEFRNTILMYKFQSLPAKRNKDADKDIKEKVKKCRDKVKKEIEAIKDDIKNYSNEFLKDQFKCVYVPMKALSDLVIAFDKKFIEKKKEKDLIDFNDIEHLALEILIDKNENNHIIPSKVALYYREKFKEVLIDEYQDSNMVQEVIMSMVSRTQGYWTKAKGQLVFNKSDIDFDKPKRQINIPNRFMVGDVKQSIYRFRQAQPEIFLEKYNNYKEKSEGNYRKIRLFKNFRSRQEIINGVNYLFKLIMSDTVGELEYNDLEALTPGAKYDEEVLGEPIEVCLIDKQTSVEENIINKNNLEHEELTDIELEGRLIAKKIQELFDEKRNFKIFDKGKKCYRNIQYKDIVILLRSTSNKSQIILEELNKYNIPVFADTNSGYFEASEIKTITSLLQIIDNPIQDIPILSVLRSPIASFKDTELIDIKMVNKNINFYEDLKLIYDVVEEKGIENYEEFYLNNKVYKAIDDLSNDLKNKVVDFIKRLNIWRDKSIHMPIDEFIWYLYMETGYYGYIGAIVNGEQRQANLRMLFEKAKQYEKTSYKGLFNFINFINKLKFSSGDLGSAKILGENENVVRIMSIHKSKGLEFPVVILGCTGKEFNFMDMKKNIIFHRELGYGPNFVDLDKRTYSNTLMKSIIKNKIKLETLSEEMRILYVALTRTREKLIITGSLKNVEKNIKNWIEIGQENIPNYYMLNTKSYMDWIGPAIFKHKDSLNVRQKLNLESELINIENDKSKWNIQICNKEMLFIKEEDNIQTNISEKIKNQVLNSGDSIYKEEINKRLSYKYKFKDTTNIPAKITVTEIKKQFNQIDMDNTAELINKNTLQTPRFLQTENKITAAERGTIMHLVMQQLNLDKVSNYEEIKAQIDYLVNKQFLTIEQSKVVNINKIVAFFKCDLGKRLLNSKNIKREIPFYVEIPVTKVYKELDEKYKDEKVLLQGVMDCYFEENEEIVLLDYKTDYVEDEEAIKQKYTMQLKYYKMALERITGKKVKDKYIYLFYLNKYIQI